MLEYVSEGIVLNREPSGELDVRVSIFTKKFGKLLAKAKSARKITSKLSAHLEPGNLIQARLVEKKGLQVADALKLGRAEINSPDLYFLDKLLALAEPDLKLWNLLIRGRFEWMEALKLLGWDREHSRCELCGSRAPEIFLMTTQEFVCEKCAFEGRGGARPAKEDMLHLREKDKINQ